MRSGINAYYFTYSVLLLYCEKLHFEQSMVKGQTESVLLVLLQVKASIATIKIRLFHLDYCLLNLCE